jgi:hypothetical protein
MLQPAPHWKLDCSRCESGRFLFTSQLSRLECRTKPMRDNDKALLAIYDTFFASVELSVLPIDMAVIDKATELRATLKVKTHGRRSCAAPSRF